ncbi:MAG: hypothetical protein U0175_04985 [Caldilineaceae bacterium]
MKLQRVYIDTSVIGGCFDSEFERWSNQLMVDFEQGRLKPVVSDIIAAEIYEGFERIQEQYQKLLSWNPDILSVTTEAVELADAYQKQGILTPKYYDDGLHIALATIAEVDVLVSWNFKHIVQFFKIRQFNAINLSLGYKPIQIFSPREVSTYEEE